MRLPGDVYPAAIGVALLIGAAGLFSLLLHRSRIPGGRPAAIVAGGLLCGVLLGPAGLQAVWPDWMRPVFIGGVEERADVLAMRSRHQAELSALVDSGVSGTAIEEQQRRQAEEIAPVERAWASAVSSHARVMGAGAVGIAMAALLIAGAWMARGRRSDASAAGAGVTACAMFICAAVPTALLLMWIMRVAAMEALAIGGAAAGGSLFGAMPMRWVGRDARRPTIRAAALTVAAMAGAVASMAIAPGRAWVVVAPLAAFGAGVLAGVWGARSGVWGARARGGRRVHAPGHAVGRAVSVWFLLPGLTAYAMHTVDPRELSGWWPAALLAIALITAGGGQFIGAWLALQTVAPERVRAKAHFAGAEMLALGVGPTQGLLCALLIAGGAVDPAARGEAVGIVMVLASALAIECGVTVNRVAVRRVG